MLSRSIGMSGLAGSRQIYVTCSGILCSVLIFEYMFRYNLVHLVNHPLVMHCHLRGGLSFACQAISAAMTCLACLAWPGLATLHGCLPPCLPGLRGLTCLHCPPPRVHSVPACLPSFLPCPRLSVPVPRCPPAFLASHASCCPACLLCLPHSLSRVRLPAVNG